METLKGLVPNLRNLKNEIVVIVGAVMSVLSVVEAELFDLNITDLSSWQHFVPVVVAAVARAFNTGPVTAANG
jgi:hypothetical protein